MDCTRNPSRIWGNAIAIGAILAALLLPNYAWGAFASQFSLTVGEQYSDNIFFERKKEHDFITTITPTLSLLYAPEGQSAPTLAVNFSPNAQFFARHSEENNFGDGLSLNGAYAYEYSPRLRFRLSDNLQRLGQTRTGVSGNEGFAQVTGPVAGPAPPAGVPTDSRSRNLGDFISRGDQISNSFSLQGSYLYAPDVSFTGGYVTTYTNFIDQGGSDVSHNVGFRGTYNWRRDHNLHAGYWISIINSRNGDKNVIHNFDVGDDYFSQYKLQLTPTFSVEARSGLSFNAGNSGPRVANNTNITATKLWETAILSGGVKKGLTPSFGVSGVSDTTAFFIDFLLRLSERLSVRSGANFALFDTEDVNFKTFQGSLGLEYLITTWLSSGFNYNFRWIDSGSGATESDLLNRGKVNANSVFLSLTARFDLWPRIGLARNLSSSTLIPVLTTPFPSAPPSLSPPTSVPGP